VGGTAERAGLEIALHEGSLDDPLSFFDGQFDLVICGLALCHVRSLRGAVSEFARGAAGRRGDHRRLPPLLCWQGWRAALFGPGRAYVPAYADHTRAEAALEGAGLQMTRWWMR
jgi:hypothetical protein